MNQYGQKRAITLIQNKSLDAWSMRGFVVDGMSPKSYANLMDDENTDVQTIKATIKSFLEQTLGVGEEWEHFFLPNGSAANQLALDLAIASKGQNIIGVTSQAAHFSVSTALKRTRIPHHILPSTPEFTSSAPRFLCVTAGQTQTGLIETIPDTQASDKVWLHVDAAYGGFNLGLLPSYYPAGQLLRQTMLHPSVHSITIDFHKFLCRETLSVLCVRKKHIENILTNQKAPYFHTNIASTITTSLSATGAYEAIHNIQTLGIEGLQSRAEECYEKAILFDHCLAQHEINTVIPVCSSIVPIQLPNQRAVIQTQENLKQHGIRTSQLCIKNNEDTLYGIRMVISPDVKYGMYELQGITEIIT